MKMEGKDKVKGIKVCLQNVMAKFLFFSDVRKNLNRPRTCSAPLYCGSSNKLKVQ